MSDCILCGAQAQQGSDVKSGADVIELDAVAYSYGGGELLSDMSLTITPGAFYFLTGPSGAGKTTFLKMCYAALKPTSGALKLFGQDVRTMERNDIALVRRRIGVVHQDCQFIDHLSVADNIALPLSVSGQDNWDDTTNLKELLAWVGLSHRANALPPNYRGVNGNARPLRVPLSCRPTLCWPTNPRATWIGKCPNVCCGCCWN